MEDDDNPEAGGGFDENMADTPSDAPTDTSDGGGTPMPEGGEPAPEGGNPLDAALSAVDAAMSYGRQKHGLLNGKQESGNIEDRRGDAPGPEQMSTYGANQQAMRNPGQPMPSSARNAWSAVAGKMSGRMGFSEGGPVEEEEDQQQIESGDESGGGGEQQPQPEAEAPPQKRGFREQLGDAIGMRGRGQQQRVARPGGLDAQEGPEPGPQYGPPKPKGNMQERLGLNNPNDPSPVKRIMAYLQGKDAAPAQSMQQLEQSVDPDGSMDPAQRNVLAVAAAKEQGGDEGAWAAAQHYRQKYDASRSFAQVALEKGNLPSAADAATKAYPNLLDGRPVTFQISQNGIVATLQDKEGSQLNLSLPQFKQWLSGLPGQFDHARQRGGFETLQQMAQGGQGGGQGGGEPAQQDQDPGAVDPRIEARARQIFPMVSQGRQKAAWIAQQEQEAAKLGNRVDVANVQGTNRTEAAKATGASRVDAATERAGGEKYKADQRLEGSRLNAEARKHVSDQNLQQRLVTMARTAQDTRTRAQATILASKIKNVPFGTPLSPQDSAAVDALFGGGDTQQSHQTPAPTGQAPAPQSQQQAAPAGQPQQQQAPKFAPGAGWQHSAKTGKYRDPQGNVFTQDGQLVK